MQTYYARHAGRPVARGKVGQRIAILQAELEQMRSANEAWRLHGAEGLRAIGWSESRIAAALVDSGAGPPYPAPCLDSHAQNIRRLSHQLADLQARSSPHDPPLDEERYGKAMLAVDRKDRRVRLHFPGEPDVSTIAQLKGYGFVRVSALGAWQRPLNSAAVHVARLILRRWDAHQSKSAC